MPRETASVTAAMIAEAFSIEHEDPFVDAKSGVKASAVLIKSALAGSR